MRIYYEDDFDFEEFTLQYAERLMLQDLTPLYTDSFEDGKIRTVSVYQTRMESIMKRKQIYISGIVCALIYLLAVSMYAMTNPPREHSPDIGKPAGHYYTTDIRAFINGEQIASYNIGGKTLICIEDLKDYGFTVYWHDQTQTIEANPVSSYSPQKSTQDYGKPESKVKSGVIAGEHYITDVRAFVNNKMTASYNIGGRTLICVEDLRYCGFNVLWNGDTRTIEASLKMQSEDEDKDFSNAKGLYTDKVKNPILEYTVPSIPGTLEGDDVQATGDRGIVLMFVSEVDDSILDEIVNKDYFPVISEDGIDLSDDFNYYYTTGIYDIDQKMFIVHISIRPSVLYEYFSRREGYIHHVKIYMPEQVVSGMDVSFDYYLEMILNYASIWVLHDAYRFYYF